MTCKTFALCRPVASKEEVEVEILSLRERGRANLEKVEKWYARGAKVFKEKAILTKFSEFCRAVAPLGLGHPPGYGPSLYDLFVPRHNGLCA